MWSTCTLIAPHIALSMRLAFAGWNTASVSTMNNAFSSATRVNSNLAAWNVLRVANLVGSFDSTTALADFYKCGIYSAWGATVQAAYPTWGSLCTARCVRHSTQTVECDRLDAHTLEHIR